MDKKTTPKIKQGPLSMAFSIGAAVFMSINGNEWFGSHLYALLPTLVAAITAGFIGAFLDLILFPNKSSDLTPKNKEELPEDKN